MGIGVSSDSPKNHLLRISKMSSDPKSENSLKKTDQISNSKEKNEGSNKLNEGQTESNRHVSIEFRPFAIKYVNYIPEIHGTREGYVKLWWFPSDFCQSRLGDRQIGSNACTLIAVILAHRIHDLELKILGNLEQSLNRRLINALAESIVDGNEIHEYFRTKGELISMNLTLPEALRLYEQTQEEWKLKSQNVTGHCRLVEWRTSVEVEGTIMSNLFHMVNKDILEWESQERVPTSCDSDLYFVLIAGGRSVLLYYDSRLKQLTLIDSHGHHQNGAVVAQVEISHLEDMCFWYGELCWECFHHHPTYFEISVLYFQVERSKRVGENVE